MNGSNQDFGIGNPASRGNSPGENGQSPWMESNQGYGQVPGFIDVPFEERKPLTEYLYAILYRKSLVIAMLVLGAGIGALYAYNATPVYRSRAVIEVEKVFPTSSNLNDLFSFFGQFDLYYQTQIETLQSRLLVERLLKRMKGLPPAEAGDKNQGEPAAATPPSPTAVDASKDQAAIKAGEVRERDEDAAITSILSQIEVTPIKGTQLIQVEMGASDPMLAKRTLQAYMETYIDDTYRRRGEVATRIKTWLSRELAGSEKQLKESQADLLEFTNKHGAFFSDRTAGQVFNYFDKAAENVLESKDQRINLEALQYEKEKVLPPNVGNDYLQNLRGQLAGLNAEYTGMKAIYSPEYFKMALLKNKIRSMEENIAELEKNTLSKALEQARKKEVASAEAYEKTKLEAMNTKSLSVQYEILKKMVDANTQLYLMLLQKAKQVELDQGILGHNVSINSSATLPLAPISPRRTRSF